MKKIQFLIIFLAIILNSCDNKDSLNEDKNLSNQQILNITVDGTSTKITDTEENAVLLSDFEKNTGIFILSALSKKQDLQFQIIVENIPLSLGSYVVYNPKFVSSINPNNYQAGTKAIYGPYPTASPFFSQYFEAYYNPELNLNPLTLTITSVTDQQWPGSIYKTKRVKGHFSSVLAFVEQDGYDWVVKKTKTIDGNFDMYCNLL